MQDVAGNSSNTQIARARFKILWIIFLGTIAALVLHGPMEESLGLEKNVLLLGVAFTDAGIVLFLNHSKVREMVERRVGLIAGFALFSSFLSIDIQLSIPQGIFYKTVGIPLGLDGTGAIAFGFLAHMGGSCTHWRKLFCCSNRWRVFQIVTVPKGILTGSITDIIVFMVFFLPIHYFVMMPAVEAEFRVTDDSRLSIEDLEALYNLLLSTDRVLWFSLFLHVLFGLVMGFMLGMMLHGDYTEIPRKKKFLSSFLN